MGFTFGESDGADASSSIEVMEELLSRNPSNKQLIHPYIGGAEINSSPVHAHNRYIISFESMPLEAAENWPDLLSIVREKVLPERAKIGGYSVAESRKKNWWLFGTFASAMQDAISKLPRCLALSRVSGNHAVAFQNTDVYFSDALVVFPFTNESIIVRTLARCLLSHAACKRLEIQTAGS
jgi:hypothetical protein